MTQNNNENHNPQNGNNVPQKSGGMPLLNCGVSGCLMTILLLAITTMGVRECRRHKMLYEESKIKHEMFMDSINKVKQNMYDYRGI